jgi:hypothetical protein
MSHMGQRRNDPKEFGLEAFNFFIQARKCGLGLPGFGRCRECFGSMGARVFSLRTVSRSADSLTRRLIERCRLVFTLRKGWNLCWA